MLPLSQKNIYVVVSQTGTALSRILRLITGARYNHASILFDKQFEDMYSFGRLNAYNPFWGGYVKESPYFGTLKRFSNTEAEVISFSVDEDTYNGMLSEARKMYEEKEKYSYNYLGLFAAGIGKVIESKKRYYCSEYVRYILKNHGVIAEDELAGIIKPVGFLSLAHGETVYKGRLKDFK